MGDDGKPSFPTDEVAMMMLPVPQQWQLEDAQFQGEDMVFLRAMSPLSTTKLLLDRQAGLALADALRSKFGGGLRVVNDLGGLERFVRPPDAG